MQGHLVIADISGYTQFLTEGELEHAHGIITDLINSVVKAIQAPLEVSSIQGDAVLMYGEAIGLSGQTVLETVESLYVAFASALENMVLNTTCDCNACANINGLGLKIVMHCGEFIKSMVGGTETLSGPDVILVHRLLKNDVRKQTGIADYLLVTEACVEELQIQRAVAGWTVHTEEYEHVGSVKGFVSSLSDVWEFVRTQRSIKVLADDAWITWNDYSTAPPAVVWDQLIDPRKRNAWIGADHTELKGAETRIGPGSEYHCAHGDQLNIFAVLDMRPNEYMTLAAPFVGASAFQYTHYLVPSGAGTRIMTFAATPVPNDPNDVTPLPIEQARDGVDATVGEGLQRLAEAADGAMADSTAG